MRSDEANFTLTFAFKLVYRKAGRSWISLIQPLGQDLKLRCPSIGGLAPFTAKEQGEPMKPLQPLVAAWLLLTCLASAAYAGGEVRLMRAFSSIGGKYGYTWHNFYMNIAVKNLAQDKKVFIAMDDGSGNWIKVPAFFVRSLGGDYELFSPHGLGQMTGRDDSCRTTTSPYGNSSSKVCDIEFAVGYEAAGKTYWDNNGGKNYHLKAASGAILGADTFVNLDTATVYSLNNQVALSGGIFLKSLAYDKKVTIVYSTDNWATVKEAAAHYQNSYFYGYSIVSSPNEQNVEFWSFSFDLPKNTTLLHFAIRYEVAGKVFWDNNFGENYRMETPVSPAPN
jgi:hypothetical protein